MVQQLCSSGAVTVPLDQRAASQTMATGKQPQASISAVSHEPHFTDRDVRINAMVRLGFNIVDDITGSRLRIKTEPGCEGFMTLQWSEFESLSGQEFGRYFDLKLQKYKVQPTVHALYQPPDGTQAAHGCATMRTNTIVRTHALTAQTRRSVVDSIVKSRSATPARWRMAQLLILSFSVLNILCCVIGLFFPQVISKIRSVPSAATAAAQDGGVYLKFEAAACGHCVPYVPSFLNNDIAEALSNVHPSDGSAHNQYEERRDSFYLRPLQVWALSYQPGGGHLGTNWTASRRRSLAGSTASGSTVIDATVDTIWHLAVLRGDKMGTVLTGAAACGLDGLSVRLNVSAPLTGATPTPSANVTTCWTTSQLCLRSIRPQLHIQLRSRGVDRAQKLLFWRHRQHQYYQELTSRLSGWRRRFRAAGIIDDELVGSGAADGLTQCSANISRHACIDKHAACRCSIESERCRSTVTHSRRLISNESQCSMDAEHRHSIDAACQCWIDVEGSRSTVTHSRRSISNERRCLINDACRCSIDADVRRWISNETQCLTNGCSESWGLIDAQGVSLPAVGCVPQRGKFDTYVERVIPTFHKRAATGLGTELTAVTLAGAWYSKSKLESTLESTLCSLSPASVTTCISHSITDLECHTAGGLEPTALTLAGVMRSLVSTPAVTTATQIQDCALESWCFDDGINGSRTGARRCDRHSQIDSDCTRTSSDEQSAAPVSGTFDLGTASPPAGLTPGSRDQTSQCALWVAVCLCVVMIVCMVAQGLQIKTCPRRAKSEMFEVLIAKQDPAQDECRGNRLRPVTRSQSRLKAESDVITAVQ